MRAKIIFLICFLFVLHSEAQVLQRDPNGGGIEYENDEFNPFSEGADSIDQEATDTTSRSLITQNTDTINFVKVVRRYDLNLERSAPVLSLDEVANYQKAWNQKYPAVNIGNNGLPIYQLTKQFDYQSGFQLGFHTLEDYKLKNNDVSYYQAQRPYSKLFYVTGTERENDFRFKHTQNFGRGLNVGVEYKSLVSNGFYQNQEINHKNVAAHTWYQSKNKKFNSLLHYINNKHKIGMNGGIVDGVDYFTIEDYRQRRNIPVNLPTAKKRAKQHLANWQNSYDFGQTVAVEINDSISDIQLVPRFRIQHSLTFDKEKRFFSSDDLETDFFGQSYYLNDTYTSDSVINTAVANEFRIKWLGNKLGDSTNLVRQNFLADAFARYSNAQIDMRNGFRDYVTDLSVGGNFRSNPLDSNQKILYRIEGAYHLLDYRQNDYMLHAEAGFKLKKAGNLLAYIEWNNQQQDYIVNHFWQTHYHFNNDYEKQNSRILGATYEMERWKLKAEAKVANVDNVYWVDEYGQQEISDSPQSYSMLYLSKDFQIRRFHVVLSGYFQATTNDEIIRVPDVIADADLFYKGPLFRNNVVAKIGLNSTWHSNMYLDHYNPSLDLFTRQNDRLYENNPQLNFITSFSLSRARLFLRLDNLQEIVPSENPIYQADLYPQHKFAFRAGINWVFVN